MANEPISGFFKALLEHVDVPIGFGLFVGSGFLLFAPWLQANINGLFQVIFWGLFAGSGAYLLAKSREWISGVRAKRSRKFRSKRSGLYLGISRMLDKLSGARGMLADPMRHASAAAAIADKYARLRDLGIPTPNIDPTKGPWDFGLHMSFLKFLMEFLSASPISELKKQARRFLEKR